MVTQTQSRSQWRSHKHYTTGGTLKNQKQRCSRGNATEFVSSNASISKVILKGGEYRSSSGHESGHDSDDMESFNPPESDTESDGAMSEGFCGDSESIVEKDEDIDEPGDVDYFDEVAALDEIGVYSDQDEGVEEDEV